MKNKNIFFKSTPCNNLKDRLLEDFRYLFVMVKYCLSIICKTIIGVIFILFHILYLLGDSFIKFFEERWGKNDNSKRNNR